MVAQPPPGAVILGITGARVSEDHDAVQAAIMRCDPTAQVWTDWPGGQVAVVSAVSAQRLQGAVAELGYGVTIRGGPGSRGTVAGLFGRIILYAVILGILGLVGGVMLGLGNSMFNPECTRPGSSGNCAIGVGVFGILFAFLGLALGAVAGLVHGLVRMSR